MRQLWWLVLLALMVAVQAQKNATNVDDDDSGIYGEEYAGYHEVTFSHVVPLGTASTWIAFLIVCVASSQLGGLVTWIGLPLLTGYIAVGVICGPDCLGLVQAVDIRPLNLVTQGAMAFICFNAGAELYIPELRNLFKKIFFLSGCLALLTFLLATAVVYGLGALLPFWGNLGPSCRGSVASITAAIMTSYSPASTIAITKEMKAKGAFTSSVLGITVLGDVFVILLFSLTTSLARTTCNSETFSGVTLGVTLGTMAASVVLGFIVGRVLIVIFSFRFIVQRFLILPIGLVIFVSTHWLSDWSVANYSGFSINLESLMICIVAGYVCTNQSSHRYRFLSILSSIGPYVFLPFFTLIGISLHLQTLVKSLAFAVLVALLRALTIFIGSSTGGFVSGTRPFMRKENMFMWMCLITQAGVSVGLASEVNVIFPHWGRSLQTALVTCILLNQILGPIGFRWAIRVVGEAGKQGDFEEVDPDAVVSQLLVIGQTPGAMAVAGCMLNESRWKVLMLCDSPEACETAKAKMTQLGTDIRKLRDDQLAREKAEREAPLMADKKKAMEEKVLANAAKILGKSEVSHVDPDVEDITVYPPRRIMEDSFEAAVFNFDFTSLPSVSPHEEGLSEVAEDKAEGKEGKEAKEPALELLAEQLEKVICAPNANLAAVVLALPEDSQNWAVAKIVRGLLDKARARSSLHAVRMLVLLKSPYWSEQFEEQNVIPLQPELHSSYVATKLLSVPFSKPLALHPALDLADLSQVVGRTLHGDTLKHFTEDNADDFDSEPELPAEPLSPRQHAVRSTLIWSGFKRGISRLPPETPEKKHAPAPKEPATASPQHSPKSTLSEPSTIRRKEKRPKPEAKVPESADEKDFSAKEYL